MARKTTERITTLHPDPDKEGVAIELPKYETMKRAILKVTPRNAAGVAFKDLARLVVPHLSKSAFDGTASVMWYTVTVKLDLEARELIERVPGARPQHIRRVR